MTYVISIGLPLACITLAVAVPTFIFALVRNVLFIFDIFVPLSVNSPVPTDSA